MPTVLSPDAFVIPARFNGPPQSANGGIACGAVARFVDGPAEVSLRTPPPLDTPLDVDRGADGEVVVRHGDAVVARARPADLDDVVPPVRPTVAQAREAMRNHPWLGERHVLSDCFVCGPSRADGLGVHFGPLPGWPKLTAALLVADATLPHGPDGALAPEIVWAALDCPSYTPEIWDARRPSLLAGLAAELIAPVRLGEPVVAVGWPLETEGRKHRSASALLGADGRLLARARALWIRLAA
jgi:hypothetical protein